MTFTEAALEVLEQEGRPMHAREIADRAVSLRLLSHVGKTPVQTMSARISAVVAKGKGGAFTRVRPGVFALTKWGDKPPGPSRAKGQSQPAPKPVQSQVSSSGKSVAESSENQGEQPAEVDPASRKRKRKRRKKRPDENSEQQSMETRKDSVSVDEEKPAQKPDQKPKPEQKPEQKLERRPDQRRSDQRRSDQRRPDQKKPEQKRPTQKRSEREKEQSDQKEKPVQQERQQDSSNRTQQQQNAATNAVQQDADAIETTDRVENFLKQQSRPMPLVKIAEEFGYRTRRGATLVEALLVADGFEREDRGLRPRFVQHRSGWALAEREVSGEIVSLERQVSDAAERLTRVAERQVMRRIRSLHMVDFIQVVTLFLRRQGFGAMNPVERGRDGEFHLSVQDRRRGGRFNTAVIARRDNLDKPIDESAVLELRGALHHYDSMRGLIVTTGTFSERARREAQVANLPPVALIDGEMLAVELVRNGIGVRERRVILPTFDDGFFGSIGNRGS